MIEFATVEWQRAQRTLVSAKQLAEKAIGKALVIIEAVERLCPELSGGDSGDSIEGGTTNATG